MTTGTTNTGNDTDEAAYWLLEEHVDEPSSSSSSSPPPPSCICYGTGRFLRSVLIPILNESFSTNVVCIQPRGTSFVSYMNDSSRTRSTTTGTTSTSTTRSVGTYEVDVVQPNGSIMTEYIGCRGVFTMNSIMHHLWPLYDTATAVDDTNSTTTSTTSVLPVPSAIRIIAIGVTEAGLGSSTTSAMKDVYKLLQYCQSLFFLQQSSSSPSSCSSSSSTASNKICVINTDNVPNNGTVIEQHMRTIATAQNDPQMLEFLQHHVVFCNTMVDRIVSARDDNPNVPRTEPTPQKAIVILDPHQDLPKEMYDLYHHPTPSNESRSTLGLVIRNTVREYQQDIQYKLCIANATHTALAHTMALLSYPQTNLLSQSTTTMMVSDTDRTHTTTDGNNNNDDNNEIHHAQSFMTYVQRLVHNQIIPALLVDTSSNKDGATAAMTTFGSHDVDMIRTNAMLVWDDWHQRLLHGSFGLSTFFITQNGAAKGGIRFTPTLIPLLQQQHTISNRTSQSSVPTAIVKTGVSVTMAYAYAALLRWLTPIRCNNDPEDNDNTIYIGWLDGCSKNNIMVDAATNNVIDGDNVTYADNLRYNFKAGWYEFKCACQVTIDENNAACTTNANSSTTTIKSVASWLAEYTTPPQQPSAYIPIIRAYMISTMGGNCGSVAHMTEFDMFVAAIATLYARMIVGDGMMIILDEMLNHPKNKKNIESDDDHHIDACEFVDTNPMLYPLIQNGMPLHYRPNPIPNDSGVMQLRLEGRAIQNNYTNLNYQHNVDDIVISEVASALVIDIHTHLLPPTHGPLCLWGIDELLTYHYLVAEYFMTAPTNVTPEFFYAQTKQEQADLIWKALFIDRMPLSEATRGVVSTLNALGLIEFVDTRDLLSIRNFYYKYRNDGVPGAERFSSMIHDFCGVRYNIMTNIPFDMNEAQHWRPNQAIYSTNYRSALRVDPLLAGDEGVVIKILRSSGYDPTIDGACQYLRDWCDTMKPEYMMASTPHNFNETRRFDVGINIDAMKIPGAFAAVLRSDGTKSCSGNDEDFPSIINERSDFLSDVLMRVCEERDLPIALKIGAHRGLNQRLKQAGDGVVACADTSMLSRLCTRFPKVRFLVTFLSRNNQHEACVLASKFSNLHLYGCWWYCFTPSIVKEITKMRIEMLGSAFTAQHSDARVLDQLIYKWGHSRSEIAIVVSHEIKKLLLSGWKPSRRDLRNEVRRLLGGSYEEFMAKSFL